MRQCCAFLTFRTIVVAGRELFCLEITGPPETKAVIADFSDHDRSPLSS